MKISINNAGEIHVSTPFLVSYRNSLQFVQSNKQWILHTLLKIDKRYTQFLSNVYYPSVNYAFVIKSSNNTMPGLTQKNKIITYYLPHRFNIKMPEVQAGIVKTYTGILRSEANDYLKKRTIELAEQFGFLYNNIVVRNQKTRWGSCSAHGNINLNLHLVRLPYKLIDFIILHELCHTRELNHSHRFYALLESILPNHKQLNAKIKQYHPGKYHYVHSPNEFYVA